MCDGSCQTRGDLWRAIEDDAAADQDEAFDEALDGAELMRDIEDGDRELAVQRGQAGRPTRPGPRRRRLSVGSSSTSSDGSAASAFAMNAPLLLAARKRGERGASPSAVDPDPVRSPRPRWRGRSSAMGRATPPEAGGLRPRPRARSPAHRRRTASARQGGSVERPPDSGRRLLRTEGPSPDIQALEAERHAHHRGLPARLSVPQSRRIRPPRRRRSRVITGPPSS